MKILVLTIAIFSSQFLFGQYTVNGNASRDDCHCYTLTPDIFDQSGSVWNNFKINLTQSFDFNFDIYLGCNDGNGADGIVFVLQPISTSVGSAGGGLGFSGIAPSVGITIDTYQNTGDSDPAHDHIAIQLNGNMNHTNAAANIAGPVTALPAADNIEDCNWHTLRVQWDAASKILTAYVDGTLRVSAVKDFVNDVFGGNPQVFWGFTGSTGGAKNLQRFCTALSPKFNLLPDQKRCINEPVTFFDSTVSFTAVQKLYWNFGDLSPIDSINKNPVHTYPAAGDYTVTQTVIGADGCVEVNGQSVKIGSIPVADFGVTNGCANSALSLSDSSKTTVGTIGEWNWDLGTVGTATVQNPTATYAGSGSQTVKLSVKSIEGCVSPVTIKTLEVYPEPIPDFDVTGTLCQKTSVQFIDRSAVIPGSIVSVNYVFGNGLQSAQPNSISKFDTAKNYAVSLTAVSDKGCRQTQTQTINILPQPTAYFKYTVAGCSPVSINFLDSSYSADGNAVNGWWWNLGNNSTSTLQNPTGTYNVTGDIAVKLVAKNAHGCFSDTLSRVITLHSNAVAKLSYSLPLCEGIPIQFSDSSFAGGGTIQSWQWQVDNVQVSNEPDPLLSLGPGDHIVKLIVANETGCAGNAATAAIFVNPKPVVDFQFRGACKDEPVTFNGIDLTGGNLQTWRWNFGDDTFSDEKDTRHIYSNAGIKNVQLSVMANNGCINFIDSAVIIYGTNASAGADTIIAAAGQSVQLRATGGISYEWEPSSGLSSNDVANPVAINNTDKLYRVRAYTPAGCATYDKVLIRIFDGPEIYVPTAFTPDGNNLNDVLRALTVGITKLRQFTVYNRYGEVVFSTQDINKGWDGYYRGKLQGAGAYTWIASGITYNGIELMRKGIVVLVR